MSLADKAHNARRIAADVARAGEAYFERFTGGKEGTRWYYRRLADRFVSRIEELLVNIAGRPGAEGLLARYHDVTASFGATLEAAGEFEATFA